MGLLCFALLTQGSSFLATHGLRDAIPLGLAGFQNPICALHCSGGTADLPSVLASVRFLNVRVQEIKDRKWRLMLSRTISERDWKVFRELRQVVLERFCDKILAEAKSEIERPGKSSHAKYFGSS